MSVESQERLYLIADFSRGNMEPSQEDACVVTLFFAKKFLTKTKWCAETLS
jgi:hypothetical protein